MAELARRANAKERVLAHLQARGRAGATNAELLAVGGFRYGARLFDLRHDWLIESRHEHDGCWRFILRGPRLPGQSPLPLELP